MPRSGLAGDDDDLVVADCRRDLVVPLAPPGRGLTLSQWAVVAMVAGASVLALIPVALEFFGTDWKVRTRSAAKPAPARRKEAAAVAR